MRPWRTTGRNWSYTSGVPGLMRTAPTRRPSCLRGRRPDSAAGLAVSSFNAGTAVGSWIAGNALESSLGLSGPALVGTVMVTLALAPPAALGTIRATRTTPPRTSAASATGPEAGAPHETEPQHAAL